MKRFPAINRRISGRKGFTLIEILIVAALIALFASLAIVNFTQQYEANRQKAAIAECRQIANALSFVNDDVGFYPKLCFLRYNQMNLFNILPGASTNQSVLYGLEYFNWGIGNPAQRLRNWKGSYLAFNNTKLVKMQVSLNYTSPDAAPTATFDWPSDQWGQPFVAYFVKTELNTSLTPESRWLTSAGDRPTNFAGVVSYGRNRVPGMTEFPNAEDSVRRGLRLYEEIDPVTFRALTTSEYTQERLDLISIDGPIDPTRPRIRDTGSDDLVVEF